MSLHFGLGKKPTFQVYRFRPTVEPRFECELGDHSPAFATGTTIVSDGNFIAVRTRSSADSGKPTSYNVFEITRTPNSGGKISGIPFRARVSTRGTRGGLETLYRRVLYTAHFDKAGQQFVIESFSCVDGKPLRNVTVAAEYSGAKVHMLQIETRHLYLVVIDSKGEQVRFAS